jgi:diguanylate cyclase (GGDEF)-like protein
MHGNGLFALGDRSAQAPARAGAVLDKLLGAALEAVSFGLIVLAPDQRVHLLSGGAARLLNLNPASNGHGRKLHDVLAECAAFDQASLPDLLAALSDPWTEPLTVLARVTAGGLNRVLSIDIRPVTALGWVLSLEDVTRARETQDWLLEHASTDAVTGLWNRQRFLLMLQDRLAHHAPGVRALLLVGLTRFKQVNERVGLGAGDMLLRMVADRLSMLLREEDMLARFGGDEFAVAATLPDLNALDECAQTLLQALAKPYVIEGHSVTLGAHIGIAHAPQDGVLADTLVAHAGLALVETTMRGAAPLQFFEPGLTQRAEQKRALEADLRHALSRGEFELHYQPQVDPRGNRVAGMEALIRWRSPGRGMVSPADFIPLAEQIGLINDIGDWVLRAACREAAHWPAEVTVAVNASPLQFETGHFARTVAEALHETCLPASRLEIEITESLLLRDTGAVMGTLAALHAMGVRLVLDDFGTGYASLSQLSRFRFDKIKIDRSFVSQGGAAAENSAIVRSIAALGTSLGIPTTAEGVETEGQLEQIKLDGCTLVQGYFFSRPVPAGDVGSTLQRLHHPG